MSLKDKSMDTTTTALTVDKKDDNGMPTMGLDDHDVEDYDSDAPTSGPQHKGNVLWTIGLFFLLSDFFERFGYYTATGSLYTFFTRSLGLSSILATQLQSVFQSLVYVVPLLGAYVADTLLGRYMVIVVFYGVYFGGLIIMSISSHPGINISALFFLGLLGGTAVGSGCIKPNLIVLGADQFRDDDPYQSRQKSQYFQYFYWMTNIAAFIAFAFMSKLATEGVGAIPIEFSFFSSFMIACGSIFFAGASFLAGSKKYHKPRPEGSALSVFCKVCIAAASKSKYGAVVLIGFILQFISFAVTIISFFVAEPAVGYTAAALSVAGILILVIMTKTDWIDYANERNGGKFSSRETNDAREVVRMFPYAAFAIMFWCVYNQMNTNFQSQGCQMNNKVFGDFTMAPSQLNTFNCLIIVILIPIVDKGLYPLMIKVGYPLTMLKRVGIGLFFTNLAVLLAGFIEIARKAAPPTGEVSVCSACDGGPDCEGAIYTNDLNMLIQIPQYMLVGIGEIFTAITYYDLFYTEVPESMRAVCQALNMLTTSLGTMVGGTINSITIMWLPDDLNTGHQEYTYFLTFGLGTINLIGFILVARGFTYKSEEISDLNDLDDEDNVKEVDFSGNLSSRGKKVDDGKFQKSTQTFIDDDVEH
eukprot:Awhi_evm1s8410